MLNVASRRVFNCIHYPLRIQQNYLLVLEFSFRKVDITYMVRSFLVRLKIEIHFEEVQYDLKIDIFLLFYFVPMEIFTKCYVHNEFVIQIP